MQRFVKHSVPARTRSASWRALFLVLCAVASPVTAEAQWLTRAHEASLSGPVAMDVESLHVSCECGGALHAPGQDRSQAPRTATSTGQVVAQLLAGVVGAWAGGYAGYRIAERAADDYTVKGDAGYSPAGNVGYAVGSGLGSALAVYAVGAAGPARGSPVVTAFCAGMGSLALVPLIDDPYMPYFGVLLVAPLQAVAATVGFHASRR